MTLTAGQVETVLDPSALHLAEQYAQALAELLGDTEAIIECIQQLRRLNELLDGVDGARDLLTNPLLTRDQRKALTQKTLMPFFDEPLSSLLGVLAANQRMELLKLLPASLHEEANRRGNRMDVYVTSAKTLNDAERAELKTSLAEAMKINPILHVETDADLIGGLTVRIGDAIYDASLRGELAKMSQSLGRLQNRLFDESGEPETPDA